MGVLDEYSSIYNWTVHYGSSLSDMATSLMNAEGKVYQMYAGVTTMVHVRDRLTKIEAAVGMIRDAVHSAVGNGDGHYRDNLLMDGFHLAWELPLYELTAGAIIGAWVDANRSTRMSTVLTLDELRRESWNLQFTHFSIAAPPE